MTTDTTLVADLVGCPQNGLVIQGDGITLNLNGHTISGEGAGSGVAVIGAGDTVKNGAVSGFRDGINGAPNGPTGAVGLLVANVTVSGNVTGIFLYFTADTHVADSTVARNAGVGIWFSLGNRGAAVSDSRVLMNGEDGIVAENATDGASYTNNQIMGNGGNGLSITEASSVVTGNTVSRNGRDGIHLVDSFGFGTAQFIGGNTANENGGLGIFSCIRDPSEPSGCQQGVVDAGGNAASRNGDPRQCANIMCARNRGLASKSTPSADGLALHSRP